MRGIRTRAKELRKRQTDAERHLWYSLRSRQTAGVKFRRQYPIAHYIADFASPKARIVIELDGSQHAIESVRDRERDKFIEAKGFRILRFWDNDVLLHRDAVLEAILIELKRPLTLTLSPESGERE